MPEESKKKFGLKYYLLEVAEVTDAFRIWPRALITLYGIMVYLASVWFMGLSDPSGPQSAFISTIWGASAAWFGIYVSTGRKWDKKQQD